MSPSSSFRSACPVSRSCCLSFLHPGLSAVVCPLQYRVLFYLFIFRTFFRFCPLNPLLRTMRQQQQQQPEMIHSPAYYEDGGQHHLMTGFLPDSSSSSSCSPSASTTTPVPTRSTTPPLSPPAAARLPEVSSGHRHSHSHQSRYQPRHHHHNHRPLSGASMGSGPEPPPPVSLAENDSIITRGSNGTSRTSRKKRVRGSLSEHSSYMSGEQQRHHRPQSASRTPKQTLYEEAPVPVDNQDALVMLVSSCDRRQVKPKTKEDNQANAEGFQ